MTKVEYNAADGLFAKPFRKIADNRAAVKDSGSSLDFAFPPIHTRIQMNPYDLLKKYFNADALQIIATHSRLVADKALRIAKNCRSNELLDMSFIEEAAMLHDIGVSQADAPSLCCHGTEPYIRHGVLGRALLEQEGLPRHALACERHIGVGLTVEDIIAQGLPLPKRDMLPVSPEEKIIACADLFYSKRPGILTIEKPLEQIRTELSKFGGNKAAVFDQWVREFSLKK